jgi:outer membrane immunogenic protein
MSAASAMAADLPARHMYTKAPAMAVATYNWTGFYAGVDAGAAWGDMNAVDVTEPSGGFFTDLVPAGTEGFKFNKSSFGVGGHVGAQYQLQQFVLGVEGAYTFTNIKKTIVSPYFPASDLETGKINDLVTVVGRVGYSFDRYMIYAKGGYAGGNVDFNAHDTQALVTYGQKQWQSGFAVGAGLDWAVTNTIRLGLDYTHIDLGRKTASGNNVLPGGALGNPESFRTDATVDMVMARLSVALNGLR